ncbi:hypothetical protein LXA43DRAFT_618515 [Ganoderma leucocontextum]|nr:hypothetical protein LXA43DRAFT_618515 [Ganoderma leucocontextum]
MASTYLPGTGKPAWQTRPQPIRIPAAAVQPTLSSQEKHTREVLLASLSGKPFEDLKFYAFSRRTSAGQIDQPLPILANSTLIRHTSPHFNEGKRADMPLTVVVDLLIIVSFSSCGPSSPGELSLAPGSAYPSRPGRVVFVEDIAHATWKAFLFYAYFGETRFARLKSQEGGQKVEARKPHEPPLCSPRSMYRLVDKYNIPALKKRAADDIKSKLGPDNIFEERFGTFTSLYPEIQEMQINLHEHIQDPTIREKLPKWMEALAEGRLHGSAAGIFSALILKFE